MKTGVLEVIGEVELKLSAAINAALAANDRLKYFFSLLQMAAAHGDHPEQPTSSLRRERLACGIKDSSLDELVDAARRDGECYKLPGWAKIREQITQDLRVMAVPVGDRFVSRLNHLLATMPHAQDDRLSGEAIGRITRVAR